MLYYLKSC